MTRQEIGTEEPDSHSHARAVLMRHAIFEFILRQLETRTITPLQALHVEKAGVIDVSITHPSDADIARSTIAMLDALLIANPGLATTPIRHTHRAARPR